MTPLPAPPTRLSLCGCALQRCPRSGAPACDVFRSFHVTRCILAGSCTRASMAFCPRERTLTVYALCFRVQGLGQGLGVHNGTRLALPYSIPSLSHAFGGSYKIDVVCRFPVDVFGGTKSIIISTTSWIGGKNVSACVSIKIQHV